MRLLTKIECDFVAGGLYTEQQPDDGGGGGGSGGPGGGGSPPTVAVSGSDYNISIGGDTYHMQVFQDTGTGSFFGSGSDGSHLFVDLAPPSAFTGGASSSDPGTFDCLSIVGLDGIGLGVCGASNGHTYLEGIIGVPGVDFQAGSTNSLSGYLTGWSASGEIEGGFLGWNPGATAGGYSYGTPSMGLSYGVSDSQISGWLDGGSLGGTSYSIDPSSSAFSLYGSPDGGGGGGGSTDWAGGGYDGDWDLYANEVSE